MEPVGTIGPNNKKPQAMTSTPSGTEPQHFVLNSVIQQLVDLAKSRGFSLDTLMEQLGVSEEQIADPNGWLPLSTLERLLHIMQTYFDDPLVGLHFSHTASPASFGALGYLTQACSTLDEAFLATTRYERLVSDFGTTSLQREPGVVICRWDCKSSDPVFVRHATEYLLGSWMNRLIQLVTPSQSGVVQAVYFRHPAPENAALLSDYEAVFHCPVYFNKPVSGLLIPASIMRMPLRHPNPELREMLERHARILLNNINTKPSLIDVVKSRLRNLLMQGHVSRDALAEQLGMSGRHLHRQLQEAGSSYREIMDELRFEIAKASLRDPTLLLDEVSQRLGFQETSAFTRWFRTVSGKTPSDYRKSLRPETPPHSG